MKQTHDLKSEKQSKEIFYFYAKMLLSDPKKLREFEEIRTKAIKGK